MAHRCGLLPAVTAVLCWALAAATESAAEPSTGEAPATAPTTTSDQTVGGPASAIDRADLSAFVDGFVRGRMQSQQVVRVTVSVVHDGEMIFARGYGHDDLEAGRAVVADRTLFRPGSISKAFTRTAVMELHEQGRLEYLRTHEPARVRRPGLLPAYSNYGVAVAGLIVANVSGMPWETYVEWHLFEPLGMNDSTFREPWTRTEPAPMSRRLLDDVSRGCVRRAGGYEPGTFAFIGQVGPAGAMSTTATDMARWMLAHLNDGRLPDRLGGARILEAETARRMHRQHFTLHPRTPGAATVSAAGDHLVIASPMGQTRLEALWGDDFRSVDTGERPSFTADKSGNVNAQILPMGIMVMEKVGPLGNPNFLYGVPAGSAFVMGCAAVGVWLRRRRLVEQTPAEARAARSVIVTALAWLAVFALAAVGTAPLADDFAAVFFDFPSVHFVTALIMAPGAAVATLLVLCNFNAIGFNYL